MLARYLPVLEWGRSYNRQTLVNDGVAAGIVTIMLIPQGLAYATLAGLPPEVGLYASILPIIAYAVFGTSRTLAVGPVAVISLMTLAAAGTVAPPGTPEFVAAALVLALLSGLILVLMGVLKLGFLANLLSHPVVSGFITASGIIIATSQLKAILGIDASGEAMPELVATLMRNVGATNLPTLAIGTASLVFLFWVRKGLKPALMRLGIPARPADLTAKAGPITAVVVSTLAVLTFDLEDRGVKVVGDIPQSLPPLKAPLFDPGLVGKGWQHDYVPNTAGALNLRDADSFSIAYDQTSKSYQITVPVAGSGTIMRTGDYSTYPFSYPTSLPGFHADPSNKNLTTYCCNALSISASDQPQSRYSYVSFVDFYAPAPAGANLDTIAYGTFAVGQPTKPSEVPTTGTARYSGDLFGHFAGDAGATWLQGTARFDFDFAQALLSGELRVGLRCMMGCAYDEVTYTFANTNFALGSTSFSGELATPGAPGTGTFSGLFAGPGAIELMSQFRLPFFNPEYQRWMDAGGVIAAKRD